MSLYSDAADGNLTSQKLRGYGTQNIDDIDSNTGFTPLIAAIYGSHVNVVKLLLDNGADPDKQSRDYRTPLFWATWKRGDNTRDIVSALIEKNAEVDATNSHVQNITPLMNAVDKLRDPWVVSLLVDAGASTTAKNRRGQTAQDLAAKIDPKLSKALRPKLERYAPTKETVNMLVSFVLYIVAAINIKSLEGVAQGVAKRVFNMTGEINPIIEEGASGPKPPKTAEEFKDKLNDWLLDSNLGSFFQSDDNYLQTLAEKALDLRDGKSPFMGDSNLMQQPENLDKLVKLSLYKTIFYCDDSGSMGAPLTPGTRASSQVQLVERMSAMCTEIIPDDGGVDLVYINADGTKNARAEAITECMRRPGTNFGTPIGTRLKQKILNDRVYGVIRSQKNQFDQPLFVTIITDGSPTHEEGEDGTKTLEKAIIACKKELKDKGYPDYAVVFQISQVGNDREAAEFLTDLRRSEYKKSIYCTEEQLDQGLQDADGEHQRTEWLFKILTTPIVGSLPEMKIFST